MDRSIERSIESLEELRVGTLLKSKYNRDKQRNGEKTWRIAEIIPNQDEEMTEIIIVDNNKADDEIIADENFVKKRRLNKMRKSYNIYFPDTYFQGLYV